MPTNTHKHKVILYFSDYNAYDKVAYASIDAWKAKRTYGTLRTGSNPTPIGKFKFKLLEDKGPLGRAIDKVRAHAETPGATLALDDDEYQALKTAYPKGMVGTTPHSGKDGHDDER